jgi:4'-phosphopantetheinyl transferase
VLPWLAGPLAPVERIRLDQLRRAEDRERFLLGRAVLRLCLGELLDQPPDSLRLAAGPRGKPCLADENILHQQGSPRFNVTHSGRLVLLGFHAAREVGVDVECHRPNLRWGPIARRFLPPQAVSRIESLSAEVQGRAFLQAWCRLEAGLKARGVGLYGLDQDPPDGTSPTEDLWPITLPEGYCGAAALV